MAQFKYQIPEQGALPPTMAGHQSPIPTALHNLRLRQLLDLAKAFGVDLPKSATTKNKVLPYMIQAEERGAFQQEPVSQYHLLHAQITHDVKLTNDQEVAQHEAFLRALQRAELKEFPTSQVERLRAAQGSHMNLQARAKALGLKDTMGKSSEALRVLIAEKERELAGFNETSPAPEGGGDTGS